MSCDDLCTTFTDLPTSYQDLLTSDKSFQLFICDQGAENASFWPGAAKRPPKFQFQFSVSVYFHISHVV